MIVHVPDASAVQTWVAHDSVLSRLRIPEGAPDVSLVGGAVRDALLGVTHGPDVDLVVEGDAIALAREIGRHLGGRVVAHNHFGTARLEFAHGRHADLVSARRESYSAPGALPDVQPGTLADDLARRDFTVNAIAYRLSGAGRGSLVDPHGGRDDLAARTLRVIRPGSFGEDPSRVVRALRYASRLGFQLDAETATQARVCLATLNLASSRVGDELRRLLHEDSAASALDIACALGADWPDPDDRRGDRLGAVPWALARPGAPAPPSWALGLGLGLTPERAATAAVPGWARAVALEVRAGVGLATALRSVSRPSEVDAMLRDRSAAEQVGALIGGAEVVAQWWEEWRDCTPEVGGADLVAAGMAPGPAIGRALRAVRCAVLDGDGGDRDAQLRLALAVAGASVPSHK